MPSTARMVNKDLRAPQITLLMPRGFALQHMVSLVKDAAPAPCMNEREAPCAGPWEFFQLHFLEG